MLKIVAASFFALAASSVFAESALENHSGRIFGGYETGDADYTISGTKYDGDYDGTAISGLFYLGDAFYFSASAGDSELDLVGTTFEVEGTSLGFGLWFGEGIDLIAGEGSEQRLGVEFSDVDVTVNGTKSTSDSTDVEYSVEAGLGDHLSGGFYFSTDTDDLFTDYSYSFALMRSVGDSVIVGASLDGGKSEDDDGDKAESSGLTLAVGFVF